jgi:hypothetical protein
MKKSLKLSLMAGVALISGAVHADDIYTFTATVGGQSASTGLSDLSSAAKYKIESLNIGYTERSAATAVLNMRGVIINFAYQANSPALQFSIPSLGIYQTFNGTTRTRSEDMVIDWFKNSPSSLSQEYVKSTSTDPISGNPNSLMSQMAASDFQSATGIGQSEGESSSGLLGVGISYGQFNSNGLKTTVTSLPLSYEKGIDNLTLLVDAPLTMIETESSKSYAGTLGVGLRTPVQEGWNLTGYVRNGVGGSRDMGTVSGVYSGSIISDFTYRTPEGGSKIMMGNMVSYMQTYPITVDGYTANYDLHNYVLRNGLAYEQKLPMDLFSKRMKVEVFAVNTYFGGSDVYIKSSTDVGFDFATEITIGNYTYQDNRLGLTYTFGGGYTGYRVNYGYKF